MGNLTGVSLLVEAASLKSCLSRLESHSAPVGKRIFLIKD
jgi:hypothetical protein